MRTFVAFTLPDDVAAQIAEGGGATYQKVANIFDPIEQNLDQHVFNGIEPRHTAQKFITTLYFRALQHQLGVIGFEWADLYFTGSLTTYQYSDTSDADISVFPNYDKIWKSLGLDPREARKELIDMSISHLDGTFLPGSSHPLQFFVVPPGIYPTDLYKPGLRSAFDLKDKDWFVKPERSRSHVVQQDMPDAFQRAADIAEKLTIMLDDHNYDAAKELWHTVHAKRQLDQRAGLGDYSEGNIVYKWLLHEGLFDRIRNELHEYIASTKIGMPPANMAPQLFKEFQNTPSVETDSAVQGFDWQVDMAAVNRLTALPTWPLKNVNVRIIKPHDKMWASSYGWYERGICWLHPFQTAEEANNTLWHELQHQYQEQEKRFDLEDYQTPGVGQKVDPSKYWDHPVEQDARDFANYMDMGLQANSALINSTEPYYNPDWIPNERHLDGEWNDDKELWELSPDQLKVALDEEVKQFRYHYDSWQEDNQYSIYTVSAVDHLWDERVTTKVIYDWDADRIVLGTQATLPDLNNSAKIVGEYVDGKVSLFEADKQWINPTYFRRLWHASYPDRELKDVYFRRETGQEYKLRSLPRKRKSTGGRADQYRWVLVDGQLEMSNDIYDSHSDLVAQALGLNDTEDYEPINWKKRNISAGWWDASTNNLTVDFGNANPKLIKQQIKRAYGTAV